MNYFSLFQLPEQFAVDLTALKQTYQTLQKLTHPDKFAAGSEKEKLIAVQKNAQVNDGFTTLKSPVSRAEHLLTLRGIELQHEQQTMQDTMFLMQQMEWRETLAEIGDDESALDELEAFEAQIKKAHKAHLATLENALNENDTASNQLAADEIRKLKFIEKLRVEIETKEESITDF